MLLTDSVARNLFRNAPLGFTASQRAFGVCPIALGLRDQDEPCTPSAGRTVSRGLFGHRFVEGQLRKVVGASNCVGACLGGDQVSRVVLPAPVAPRITVCALSW